MPKREHKHFLELTYSLCAAIAVLVAGLLQRNVVTWTSHAAFRFGHVVARQPEPASPNGSWPLAHLPAVQDLALCPSCRPDGTVWHAILTDPRNRLPFFWRISRVEAVGTDTH